MRSRYNRASRAVIGYHGSPRWRRNLVAALLAAAVAVGLAVADRAGLFGRQPSPDRQRYHNQTFTVSAVVDGDTLDVDIPDIVTGHSTTRIRLWGVDTPEVHGVPVPQHFGPEASAFTGKLMHQRVRLELEPHDTRDKYNRLLAYVYMPDGRMLNEELLRGGLAYADPRFEHSRKAVFSRLAREAMKSRRGLWADVTRDDLPYYLRETLKLPGDENPLKQR